MKVIDHLETLQPPDFSVVTIGTFDGVHLGHQTILNKIVSEAKANKGKSILITFWPHPRFILRKDNSLRLLSTFDEKIDMIKKLGVDYIIKCAFTPKFSSLSAHEFVQQILIDKVNTKKLYIGYDHHFGNNREGNINFLKVNAQQYGFQVQEISKQDIDDIGISSTKVRQALLEGDVAFAKALLGRNYSLSGEVVHGEKNGRKIGFPTANINVSESYKLLPSDGVYAIKASLEGEDKMYDGVLNIGFKPTLDGNRKTVEAHLFNFTDDIYGRSIKVEFVKILRKEIKFNSLKDLQNQLILDKEYALKILL